MKQPESYRIEITPAADRDLQKLADRIKPQDFERLRSSITDLADNTRPHNVRKIKGSDAAYRIRVGRYRVVYDVYDSEKLVLVLQITRRSETTYRT